MGRTILARDPKLSRTSGSSASTPLVSSSVGECFLSATQTTRGIKLEWHDVPLDKNSVYFAVYRFGGGASETCDFEDPGTSWRPSAGSAMETRNPSSTQLLGRAASTHTYYVTALNRLHRESKPSKGRSVTVR